MRLITRNKIDHVVVYSAITTETVTWWQVPNDHPVELRLGSCALAVHLCFNVISQEFQTASRPCDPTTRTTAEGLAPFFEFLLPPSGITLIKHTGIVYHDFNNC